jgi:hypothetical protein
MEIACYLSVQNRFLSININIKIYKTKILSCVLHGCNILSLVLRKEHILRVFLNRAQRIFEPEREK